MLNIPEKIYLIDLDPQLISEWREQFKAYSSIVEAKTCDYFEIPADCMVSPANSFGYMDGGLDRAITYEFGTSIQDNVQAAIIKEYHGELPIGSAVLVDTGKSEWPFLIAAPTMRLPEDVSNTINAYLAFRAILITISKFNANSKIKKINSLVCSGLATGIGNLSSKQCALQMKMAYESCLNKSRILKPSEIYESQSKMKERQ